jgi:hypothetical protein
MTIQRHLKRQGDSGLPKGAASHKISKPKNIDAGRLQRRPRHENVPITDRPNSPTEFDEEPKFGHSILWAGARRRSDEGQAAGRWCAGAPTRNNRAILREERRRREP